MKYYKIIKINFLTSLVFYLISNYSFVDYYATGPIRGEVCKGIGIKFCDMIEIYALDDKYGKLFTIKRKYKTVDKYKRGICYIQVKNQNADVISNLFSKVTGPNYF